LTIVSTILAPVPPPVHIVGTAAAVPITVLATGAPMTPRRLEHAFAAACQLGDSCWESIAARVSGWSPRREARSIGP
jgi:hypothetical protein